MTSHYNFDEEFGLFNPNVFTDKYKLQNSNVKIINQSGQQPSDTKKKRDSKELYTQIMNIENEWNAWLKFEKNE